MGNYLSAFTIYEIFRILIPGFYSTLMLKMLIRYNYECFFSSIDLNELESFVVFFIVSVLFGSAIYSVDICRLFKGWLSYLPTNMLKKTYHSKIPNSEERYLEGLYYRFNNNLDVVSKSKTEIQSGLYYLFTSLSFVGLFWGLLFLYRCNNYENFLAYNIMFAQINFNTFLFSALATIAIYKFRLRYSWKNNFEEFVIAVKNSKPGEELYNLT